MPRQPFPRLCSALLIQRNGLLLKHSYMYCRLLRSTTCVGTSTIRLCSIKSSLPLRHSRDKLYHALSHFFILQAMESWAGPGNEHKLFTISLLVFEASAALLSSVMHFVHVNSSCEVWWVSWSPKPTTTNFDSGSVPLPHIWKLAVFLQPSRCSLC